VCCGVELPTGCDLELAAKTEAGAHVPALNLSLGVSREGSTIDAGAREVHRTDIQDDLQVVYTQEDFEAQVGAAAVTCGCKRTVGIQMSLHPLGAEIDGCTDTTATEEGRAVGGGGGVVHAGIRGVDAADVEVVGVSPDAQVVFQEGQLQAEAEATEMGASDGSLTADAEQNETAGIWDPEHLVVELGISLALGDHLAGAGEDDELASLQRVERDGVAIDHEGSVVVDLLEAKLQSRLTVLLEDGAGLVGQVLVIQLDLAGGDVAVGSHCRSHEAHGSNFAVGEGRRSVFSERLVSHGRCLGQFVQVVLNRVAFADVQGHVVGCQRKEYTNERVSRSCRCDVHVGLCDQAISRCDVVECQAHFDGLEDGHIVAVTYPHLVQPEGLGADAGEALKTRILVRRRCGVIELLDDFDAAVVCRRSGRCRGTEEFDHECGVGRVRVLTGHESLEGRDVAAVTSDVGFDLPGHRDDAVVVSSRDLTNDGLFTEVASLRQARSFAVGIGHIARMRIGHDTEVYHFRAAIRSGQRGWGLGHDRHGRKSDDHEGQNGCDGVSHESTSFKGFWVTVSRLFHESSLLVSLGGAAHPHYQLR